jgi:adenylosuccinate lyase
MLILMVRVIKGLEVDKKRMRKNMEITQGRMMSEAVMLALAKKGLGRQKAHELTRQLAIKSYTEQRSFKEIIRDNKIVQETFNSSEIEDVMNPENYLGTALEQIDLVIEKTRQERKIRGLSD